MEKQQIAEIEQRLLLREILELKKVHVPCKVTKE